VSAFSEDIRPSGSLATILGGIVGGAVGLLAALPIGDAFSGGGLEGLGRFVLILFSGICVGASLGVGIALRIRRHARWRLTAALALPAMFLAVVLTVRSGDFFGVRGFGEAVLLGAISSVLLWLVRALAMVGKREGPEGHVTGE
jgi:hypothetical protein